MKTRPLGNTGLSVSRIGLGAMPLSIAARPNEADAIKVLHAALDAGMTLIDTADVYCLDHTDVGHNERLVAKALRTWRGNRDAIVVATKGGLKRPGGGWEIDAHPQHLKTACENSLRALAVESVTLYQLHAPDKNVPFTDSVGALADLKAEGKIRHIGLSNVSLEQIQTAEKIASIASVQNYCNPYDRTAFSSGIVPYCAGHRMAFLPHSPVGGHRRHNRTPEEPTLAAVAERLGVSPYQICLAWLLATSPAMIPIPGASRAASALSSAAAADLELGPDDLADIKRAFPI